MAYNQQFKIDLDRIDGLIKAGNLTAALTDFDTYLQGLVGMNGYGSSDWDLGWRESVERFGINFLKNDAGSFFDSINKAIQSTPPINEEILNYIFSEIAWNFYNRESEYLRSLLHDWVKKYPANPEFHRTYSQYLLQYKNYERAIAEARLAYKIENSNPNNKVNCFNIEKKYFDELMGKGKIEEAKKILDDLGAILDPDFDAIFNNIRLGLYDRIADHIAIGKRIKGINELIDNALARERGKLIEVLGIFVAILAFVFINFSIALHGLSVRDIFVLMLGMADILVIFSTTISYLFSKPKKDGFWGFLASNKFWAIIVLVVILWAIFHFYT